MDGLLLRLLDDKGRSPGRWFWPCFKPLRATFDTYYWIFMNQPWMGAPAAFDQERETANYDGIGETSVCLWRPGAIGRWADRFAEEQIELWAVDPEEDPSLLASAFQRTLHGRAVSFIEKHAQIWMIYTDSTCWEIFAKQSGVLQAVRERSQGHASFRVEECRHSARSDTK